MHFLLALAAIGALASGAESTAKVPDFEGRFTITYQPIYCVRAPCPPGSFTVVSNNEYIASSKTIEIDESAVPGIKKNLADGSYHSSIAFDGVYWLDGDTLIIRPIRIIPGTWKDEPALEAEDSGSNSPLKLTVVNGTRDVVRGLFVAPAEGDHWGPERLSDNLAIRQKVVIDLPAGACVYDVRIVLGVRPAEEIRRVNVCRDPVLKADKSGRIVDRAD